MARDNGPMRSHLVPLILVLLFLSGCTQKTPAPKEAAPEVVHIAGGEADPAQAGEIVGRVFDDEFRPLPAVSVAVQGINARTKTTADGIFYFASVPPRAYQLSFEKLGFQKTNKSIVVQPQQRAVAEVLLVQTESDEAFVDDGFVFRGRINCSVRANASGTNANPECGQVLAETDNLRQRKFDILPGIRYLLIEVDWRPTVGTINDRLTLALRVVESESWRQVQGTRPIRTLVTPAEFEAMAKEYERNYPKSGGQLQFFMFPGETASHSGHGAGTTVMQDFTIYATAWYRMEYDPEHSRLPK